MAYKTPEQMLDIILSENLLTGGCASEQPEGNRWKKRIRIPCSQST